MRAKECVIRCHCERGALLVTSLKSQEGLPAFFWVTEDEKLFVRGVCSRCGDEIVYSISLLELLLSCPGKVLL